MGTPNFMMNSEGGKCLSYNMCWSCGHGILLNCSCNQIDLSYISCIEIKLVYRV